MSQQTSFDRVAFEDNVAALHKVTTSNSHRLSQVDTYKLRSGGSGPKSNEKSTVLPLDIEVQLADDFAFIAAWESTPGRVSAASIAQNHDRGSCIFVAANEGVAKPVKDSLMNILMNMRQCSLCHISKISCSESILNTLIDLHKGRIFERLGSTKAKKYRVDRRWQVQIPVAIVSRLRSWVVDLNRKAAQLSDARDLIALKNAFLALEKAAHRAEEANGAEELTALSSVTHAAEALLRDEDGCILTDRLRRHGFDHDIARSKEFRTINAIANYSRISRYLARAARKYKSVFRAVSIVVVTAPKMTMWRTLKHFVHAEIQIVLEHESNQLLGRARYIGTSKRACLLCYYFICAHGSYEPPSTHMEVMPQWTIPTQGLEQDSRTRIQNALLTTAKEIQLALCREKSVKRKRATAIAPIQAHSAINLSIAPILTPSAATIAIDTTYHGPTASINVMSIPPPYEDNQSFSSDITNQSDEAFIEGSQSQRFTVTHNNNATTRFDGCVLDFELPPEQQGDIGADGRSDAQKTPSGRASCRLQARGQRQGNVPLVNLLELNPGQSVTLQTQAEAEYLRFEIQGSTGQVLSATVHWYPH